MKVERYKICPCRCDRFAEIVIDPDGSVCYTRDVEKLEALNAELLEALENVYYPILSWLGEFDSESSLLSHPAMQKARAAIAKAKGEEL